MNIILFDGKEYSDLLPLTFTRPVAELRMGILTFAERWKLIFQTEKISYLTQRYLSEKYTLQNEEENVFINPAYFPNQDFIFQLKNLKFGEAFYYQEELVAAKTTLENFQLNNFVKKLDITFESFHIQYPWDLFTYNSEAITYDFQLITQGRKSCTLSNTVRIIGDPSQLFVEEGAVAECAILNTKEGPIYLGKNSEIMEGAMIRGSFALGTGSKINMGAKVYGATTVGPYSKVGGEVNNIIILGYSNKGHDGFVGNSVIGEWCNLGADTNSSNLKNNYAEVKLWNYTKQKFIKSGLQFAGMIMGDHSKSAINTQFNTGTVVGVSANIFTSGFPPNIIKSFSWGGKSESPNFKLEQVFEVAEKTMKRRGIELSEQDKKIIEYIYNNY
ncbi:MULTISPECIES: GlmU family protein [unclassified Apibacter]|uniref:GlmU family protein n=1 Tax=unclassified Apibacter TaxID=2630820 RepID=UPI001325DE1A|nr:MULTISPECIES: GlmU family protein [unclassified Apibacter]MCX8677631.1 GlmU family protein [Apibacter sp. B3919]MXO24172.1 glucose-1-phosphate thymidylyltransferase [Apibacter sp. B3924]MXO26954.1 glucose-1-phosphate thymidylyltransferase [Apibacter sp. B3813]MXO28918.1 glucose-1-phosphate thymidylyltransferase [Apibacter sp. B3913]MXO30869.1 glucose-1-phosphate thymidylyltransferase [Apibacter sp. B3912]